MRILFTSVGRRVELMQAFRRAADELKAKLVIYGADITDSAPALLFCDKTVIVKRISDPEYISQLLEICEREQISALIPTIDTDLLKLSEGAGAFDKIGTKVLIAAPEKIGLCRDKRLTADYFISCGLNSPRPVDDYTKYTGGYPAFIKPKDGSSSINAYKVNNEQELKTYAARVDDYIVQPFIEGREYTIDAFCDLDGEPIFITPRERLAVRSGEVLKTQIANDETMINECKKLLADFKPKGAITVQLIRQSATGDNYYIEINPRFGGGAPLSIKAGADSARECIRMLLGEKTGYIENAARDAEVYSRFDQSVCIGKAYETNSLTELDKLCDELGTAAVIFDLDDTLYPEKDYVKCGYKAVAEFLGNEEYSDRLWQLFENGEPAIDKLLEEIGQTDKKADCLKAYRYNIPKLCLYEGVWEMIDRLKAKGIALGLITDGRPEGQRNKIGALGLYELFEENIIITDELGGAAFRKPCDIAFRIMQRRLGVAFEKMMYVGDNSAKDFKAPLALGMKAVHFRNENGLYD
ncbi:MAG: ATP-grasp domain-containing protein [Ruminococcus sp.]|nr:ATP-grasp domain-containing protein [Ruminococcus sp.]